MKTLDYPRTFEDQASRTIHNRKDRDWVRHDDEGLSSVPFCERSCKSCVKYEGSVQGYGFTCKPQQEV